MAGFFGIVTDQGRALDRIVSLPNLDERSVGSHVQTGGRFHIKHFFHTGGRVKVGESASGETLFAYVGFIDSRSIGASVGDDAGSPAQRLAEAFEQDGDALWGRLNGGWTAAVWQRSTETLTLAADIVSSIPVYYLPLPEGIAVSTSQMGLMRYCPGGDVLDAVGVAEMLAVGYPQGSRTLIRGAHTLPGGSFMRWRARHSQESQYWTPNLAPDDSLVAPDDAADRINELLDRAVDRFCEGQPVGMAITGGLDSRQVIARLKGRCGLAATFGDPGNPDVAPAAGVCRHLGIPHATRDYTPDDFHQYWRRWAEINDGLIVTPEYLLIEERLAQDCRIVFHGGLGGALRGKSGGSDARTRAEIERVRDRVFNRENMGYLPVDDLAAALGDRMPADAVEAPRRNFNALFEAIDAPSLSTRCFWHNISGRQRRRTLAGLGAGRAFAEVRTPYTDRDLLEFMLRIPPALRYGPNDTYRLALIRKHPDVAALANNMGQSYTEEAQGRIRVRDVLRWVSGRIPESWRRRVYRSRVMRGRLNKVIGYAPPTSHLTAYRTTMADTVRHSVQVLVDAGIMNAGYAAAMLKGHFEGDYDRSSFFHKVLPLALIVENYGGRIS